MEDELLANKEDIVDPMIAFLEASRDKFMTRQRPSSTATRPTSTLREPDLADELRDILGQELCFEGNVIQSAASKQAELEILITDALEAKRSEARTKLEEMKARLHGTEEYTAADPDKKAVRTLRIRMPAGQWTGRPSFR